MSILECAGTTKVGWWERNRYWIIAALAMTGASLGHSWHGARAMQAANNRITPIEVAGGFARNYEGARWRVVEARLINEPPASLRMHPDAVLLVVDYQVMPDVETTLKYLDQCRGRVSDAQGRHWEPYGLLPPAILGNATDACGGRGEFAVGPATFRHAYEVPRGLPMAGLHPEIYFPVAKTSAPGSYLRFEL